MYILSFAKTLNFESFENSNVYKFITTNYKKKKTLFQ